MILRSFISAIFLSAVVLVRGQEVSINAAEPAPATTEAPAATIEPGESVSPLTEVSPEDFTLRAGTLSSPPQFDIGRRLRITTSVTGGYDDNANLGRSAGGSSASWFAGPSLGISYLFGSARLALDLLGTAGFTYYFSEPGGRDFDRNIDLRLTAAYKASARLTLNFSTATAYQSQPDFSSALSVNRRLGDFFRTRDHLSAEYRLNPRFSTVTGYNFAALIYESSEGALHDRIENGLSEALRYLLFPTTTATAEYSFNYVDYTNINSSSMTHSLSAGLDQSFSPRLTGLLRGGVQFRSSTSGNGAERTSPYGEVTVHYGLNQLVSSRLTGSAGELGSFIAWSNRYSVEESDIPGVLGRETYRTNLQLLYEITPRIAGLLTASYSHGTDEGSLNSGTGSVRSSSQNVFDIAPSLRYSLTPNLVLTLGYRHTENDRGRRAVAPGFEEDFSFSRNRYFAGVNFTF